MKLPGKGSPPVLGVSCGNNHSLLWTATDVLVSGCNNTGQLGLGADDELVETTFTPVPYVSSLLSHPSAIM